MLKNTNRQLREEKKRPGVNKPGEECTQAFFSAVLNRVDSVSVFWLFFSIFLFICLHTCVDICVEARGPYQIFSCLLDFEEEDGAACLIFKGNRRERVGCEKTLGSGGASF